MPQQQPVDEYGIPVKSKKQSSPPPRVDEFGIEIKKKDGGGKASPSGSTPTPTNQGQPPIASGSELPLTPSEFGVFGLQTKKKVLTTADGFELPADHNKLPDFIGDKEKYLNDVQKRIAEGDYSSADIDAVSKATGKSRKSVEGYLKDKSQGLAIEDQEQLQQKTDELQKSITSYNKEMGTILDPKDILSSAQKTSEFIQQVQQAKTKVLAEDKRRRAMLQADPDGVTYSSKNGQLVSTPNKDIPLFNTDPNAFINKFQDYLKVLENHAVKLTIDEGEKAGTAPDKIVVQIAQRIDPRGYAQAAKVANTPKGLDAISDTDINPGKVLGHLAEEVFGTKTKDDLLNSVKGDAEMKYQNGLRELAVNKISAGITNPDDPKSQELIKEGQDQLKQVDDNAIYKYPALVKREIAKRVSEQIAKESGQLQGSSVESLTGLQEKFKGAGTEDYIRVMQQLGYFDNPKTKDAAAQLIGQPELFSDASYTGSFGSSLLQPIKDLGYSVGDLTGYRNARDVYASKISDELFPKETANLKDHVGYVRNVVNTTGNLIGMTAIAVGTEGLGEGAGLSANAATKLGAYTSFGLPSFDAAYKESYNFLDNDAARGLYATATAVLNAEGGRILDLGKVARIPGVSDAIATIAEGSVNKTIGRDAAKELLGQQQNKYVDFAVKYGKNVTKGAATMAYFNATDNILKATFGDPSVKADDIIPQTAHAFFGGVLGMSIMGAWGAAADMRKESNTTYKGTIYNMALNHDAAADVFKIALDNGSISKDEYTNKMSVLNGAKMAKDVVELAAQEKKLDLTHDQKAVFVANKTVEGVLKQKRDNTQSEAEKEKIQSQIDRLHAQSNEIFDGLKFNEVLEPLYDLHNAEKEYNKALDDVKAGRITDNEFEAKKNAFEKLQYNYFDGGMEKDAKNNEVKRLLKKGIESGDIPDTYKAYEQHPDHLLKFIANQSQGLMEDAEGTMTKHPSGGNEAGMRQQFGDALVDHALESHPLPNEFKAPEAQPQPIIVRHAEAEEAIIPGEPENKNPQLTDSGKKQAEQLGKDFKEKGVTQIISSPADRSLDTANIASKESGASVRQDERLAEYDPNKETLDTFANRVSEAMTDVKKLGPETAVVTHGAVLAMVEALDKNNGDVETAKKDFENSKEYGNTETYVPPSNVSVIQPGGIPAHETTTISPKPTQDGNETKETLPQANEVGGSQGAAAESVTAPYNFNEVKPERGDFKEGKEGDQAYANANIEWLNKLKNHLSGLPSGTITDSEGNIFTVRQGLRGSIIEDEFGQTFFKNGEFTSAGNSIRGNFEFNGEPPAEPPPVTTASQTPPEQWTAIRKEKQQEIDAVKAAYEKQGVKTWTETMSNALSKLQTTHTGTKGLYEAALAEMGLIRAGEPSRAFTTDESLAAMQFLKRELEERKFLLSDNMQSDSKIVRLHAVAENKILSDYYNNTALAIKEITSSAGRTLNYAQSELGYDPDHGLQLRRMDLMAAAGGGKLSEADLDWTAAQWEKEKENLAKQQDAREKSMQESFDKQMQKLQSEYEKKLKDAGKENKTPATKREKTLKETGDAWADKILKAKFKSDPNTLQSNIFGLLPATYNLLMDGIAATVRAGARIGDAIATVLKDPKYKGITEKEVTDHLLTIFDRQENRAAAFEKIKEHSATAKVSDVTNDMVAKGFVRDYVNSHIGETAPKDVINTAFNDLKQILPDLTKEKLREAYLKEGEFKQPSKKDLETQHSKDRKELVALTKLEEDIDDLKAQKDLKVRGGKSEREKGEHEVKLINERDELLKIKDRSEKEQKRVIELNSELDRITARKEKEKTEKKPKEKEVSEREQEITNRIKDEQDKWDAEKKAAVQAKEDYRKLETERNRQLNKVAQLKDKVEKLSKGIREKTPKGETPKDTPEIEALKEQVKTEDKKLREIEKEQKREDNKSKARILKIAELDAKIRRLKERGELIKETNKKEPEEIDKTIKAMQDKLDQKLRDKGLKLSNEDKYTKASHAERAKSHNDRLDGISKKIQDRIDKGDLTQEQKDSLSKLKNRLDGSKINLAENNALSNEPVVEQGLELLKKTKSEFDREAKSKDMSVLGDFSSDLRRAIEGFNTDRERSEQNVKLQRTKDQLRASTKETERKLNAGEFEDKPPVVLNKSDAELVRLQIENNKIKSDYNKKKQELEAKNKSGWKQAAELTRAAYVTALIWKFGTFGKVATMALVRPTIEAATKLTGGKLFNVLAPDFSAAAKRGGESNSLRTIAKSYEAQWAQYGEQKLQELYQKSSDKYEASERAYNEYQSEHEKIKEEKGPDSKEFQQSQQKLQELKDQRDKDLLSAVANFTYQFIGGSSIKDALDALLHRSNKIEREFGDTQQESFKDGNTVDKINFVLGYVGRSHSALKTLSGRAAFAAGFVARLEGAMAEGKDITSADKLLEIANDSYLDWQRGKYQQSNFITDMINEVSKKIEGWQEGKKWEAYGKAAAFIFKLDLPITRVPVNILHEAVVEYTFGLVKATRMMANEYRKANKEVGISQEFMPDEKEFKQLFRERIQNMDADKAATIARCFRKGAFGLGIYATVALLGVAQFGGFYAKGQKKKKPDELAEGELNPGEIMLGKTKQGEMLTKIIEHTPALYPSLFAANLVKVHKDKVEAGESTWEAAGDAVLANIHAMYGALPISNLVDKDPVQIGQSAGKGALQSIGKAWEANDIDANGNPIERKAFDFKDQINLAIGRRGEVLTDENYKQATSINNAYKKAIQEAYKEKQTPAEIEALKKERDDAIDEIYKQNKEDNP